MSSLAAGATLCDGRYRLDEVVGRGGMAMVWRATDLQLERPVAIKVISDVLAGDPRFVARFEREARLAAALNHPSLVKVFDFSTEGERPLLIMEYVGGGTLAPERAAGLDSLTLARDLLDALAHIHQAGILHRDIKPANVLIGDDGRVRLTDFGIARAQDQTGLTLTGQVLGTLRYIAPEIAEGREATVRSDLYSLGVLLGEVAGPGLDPALARLVRRLADPDPALRPASAAAALAELEPTDPTVALPGTRAAPAADHRRHIHIRIDALRLGLAAGALAVAIALIALASGGEDPRGSSAAPLPVRAQPRPAAPDAALDSQLSQLQKLVDSAPRR